jgi:hypothetical protein
MVASDFPFVDGMWPTTSDVPPNPLSPSNE